MRTTSGYLRQSAFALWALIVMLGMAFPMSVRASATQYTSSTIKGATTAAYGINSFPTTLAIGRNGRVIGEVSVRDPEGLAEINKLIDSKKPAKD
jgi:hypothetical protein